MDGSVGFVQPTIPKKPRYWNPLHKRLWTNEWNIVNIRFVLILILKAAGMAFAKLWFDFNHYFHVRKGILFYKWTEKPFVNRILAFSERYDIVKLRKVIKQWDSGLSLEVR